MTNDDIRSSFVACLLPRCWQRVTWNAYEMGNGGSGVLPHQLNEDGERRRTSPFTFGCHVAVSCLGCGDDERQQTLSFVVWLPRRRWQRGTFNPSCRSSDVRCCGQTRVVVSWSYDGFVGGWCRERKRLVATLPMVTTWHLVFIVSKETNGNGLT